MISTLIEQRFGQISQNENNVNPNQPATDNETLRTILGHASAREFEPESIPEPLMQQLFASAFSAPSKSDLQQCSVVRITDRNQVARIAASNSKVAWIQGAPQFMVWCGDNRRIRKVSELREHPFANDHLDAFMNAAVDAAIVMQTFIIAAESIGLRCCPVSEIRDDIDFVSQALSLPKHVFPIAGLCVGWPQNQPTISMRLPLEVTVHENTYNDDGLAEKITSYDQRREQIDATAPAQQRHVAHFGVSEQYGWSENRARQYAFPLRADFGDYISKQGFNLS